MSTKICSSYELFFISMVLLRIPTAVQPGTGIERFKYQASDGKGSVIHTPHLTLTHNDTWALGVP